MTRHSSPKTTTTRPARMMLWGLLVGGLLMLTTGTAANAGTYTINNCPSAPVANSDPGPWTIFNTPGSPKGSCGGGPGDWIGPRGPEMAPQAVDGVQVSSPKGSGITIREAKVWWFVPHEIAGALTYALALANGGIVGEFTTPAEWKAAPTTFVLPSTTTNFTLEDYCSNSAAGQGCVFGGNVEANLELFGSQLTLADSRLPTGKTTGGALTSTTALTGTQALSYDAEDTDTGVRLVKLLIDGHSAATNDYLQKCPYSNFQACPASESDTITWNTATAPDGQHSLQAIVENSAKNTSTFYTATITTTNAPSNTTKPTITAPNQVFAGVTLAAQPGAWTAPAAAGSITYSYQWQDCDAQSNNCTAIAGAQNASYAATPSDTGHTLRVLVNAADNDGQASGTSAASTPVLSSQGSLGAPNAPGTSTATPGGMKATGLGTPNGSGASETAMVRLGVHTALSRTFAQSSFQVAGRLIADASHPIAGASLDILQQPAGNSTPRLITHIKTRADGTFTVRIPAGPSRLIQIAYRAYSADIGYATQTSTQETVSAGVQLHITRVIARKEVILISGRVLGSLPASGVIVHVQIFYRKTWVPLRNLRTSRNGSYHFYYQFQGTSGRFPVLAEIPKGQASFPYSAGHSTIHIATN